MNQTYAGAGHRPHFSGSETAAAAPILWHDERPDPALEVVYRALRTGEHGTARLRLMQLTETAQAEVMQRLPLEQAMRLARGLSNYSVAKICERLPASDARAILQAMPPFKRQGVDVILAHRRNL